MRKLPIGSRCFVGSDVNQYATVLKHGRDVHGIYTEVSYDNGQTERLHRSMLKAVGNPEFGPCGLQHKG